MSENASSDIEYALPPIEERPLVTFALFAYNQEELIADAMKAALMQDYSPLEIIVSDDCSTDDTWGVILSLADDYHGPHTLKIIRNTANLGIGPHVSKVGNEANGKLIVVAAGDDISTSNRVSVLVNAWCANGYPDGALHSAVLVRNMDGRTYISKGAGSKPEQTTMKYFVSHHFKGLFFGAAAAYTSSIFTRFPPITAAYEDVALTFRALLIGKVLYVDNVLVEYNFNESSVTRPLRVWERYRVKRWFDSLYENVIGMELDYTCFLHENRAQPDPLIKSELIAVKSKRARARGLATKNPLKFLVGFLSYPYGVSLRSRIGFYRTFLGLGI